VFKVHKYEYKLLGNSVNKHYNIIICVGLDTYKYVFIFVYFKQKGITSTKIKGYKTAVVPFTRN
jgi:hypothetical protein